MKSGEVTLWDSSQSPFAQRDLIAETLGISQSAMRVIAPLVGGGFGGKAGVSMESLAVAIATKVKGYPVKLLLHVKRNFTRPVVRQGLVAHYQDGLRREWPTPGDGKHITIGMAGLTRNTA